MKDTNITAGVKSWWAGSSDVEPFMTPVAEALNRHLKGGPAWNPAWTDIYNRAYEAVYKAIQGAAPIANHPFWRDRALKAEDELHKCYKDIEELTAERTDLKAMLADAGVRNAVLEKRVDKLLEVYAEDRWGRGCPSGAVCEEPTRTACKHCWREHMVHELGEVQA